MQHSLRLPSSKQSCTCWICTESLICNFQRNTNVWSSNTNACVQVSKELMSTGWCSRRAEYWISVQMRRRRHRLLIQSFIFILQNRMSSEKTEAHYSLLRDACLHISETQIFNRDPTKWWEFCHDCTSAFFQNHVWSLRQMSQAAGPRFILEVLQGNVKAKLAVSLVDPEGSSCQTQNNQILPSPPLQNIHCRGQQFSPLTCWKLQSEESDDPPRVRSRSSPPQLQSWIFKRICTCWSSPCRSCGPRPDVLTTAVALGSYCTNLERLPEAIRPSVWPTLER